MTLKAGWMLVGLLGLGLMVGCGDGAKRVITNSAWVLKSDTGSPVFQPHVVMSADGEQENSVDCEFRGGFLTFTIDHANIDEFGERAGQPSTIQLSQASADGSTCSMIIQEAVQQVGAMAAIYRDMCGGGCTLSYNVLDDGATINGTLLCTNVKDNAASQPLKLISDVQNGMDIPMTFSFENCRH